MRDVAIHSASEHGPKTGYSIQGLLAEVAALRNHVREIEDDGSSESRIGPASDDSAETVDQELANLKKKLIKVASEKADLEMDFMNQLSMLNVEKNDIIEDLKSKLALCELETQKLKESASNSASIGGLDQINELSKELEIVKACHEAEVKKLNDHIASAGKELASRRAEIQDMKGKLADFEAEKASLLDEMTGLRMGISESESQKVSQIREEMHQMEEEYNTQFEAFESQLERKDDIIRDQDEAYADLNDQVHEFEIQKAMLLDEITTLRIQLDREEKVKSTLKSRINDLTVEKSSSDEDESSKFTSLEQRAETAEQNAATLQTTVDELQNEILTINRSYTNLEQRSMTAEKNSASLQAKVDELQGEIDNVTTSYKAEVTRLDEGVASRDTQLAYLKKMLQEKEEALQQSQDDVKRIRLEMKALEQEYDIVTKMAADKDKELASLITQRTSIENMATHNIMGAVAEVDDLREQTNSLNEELQHVSQELEQERESSAKLRFELAHLKASGKNASRSIGRGQAPPPPPPTPSPRSWPYPYSSASPPNESTVRKPAQDNGNRTPVRGLVASFEKRISNVSQASSANLRVDTDCDMSFSSDEFGQVEELKEKLAMEKDRVRDLQTQLQKQTELVNELRVEISALSASRASMHAFARKDYEQRSREDRQKIELLQSTLADTEQRLEEESTLVEALKVEINQLTNERMAYEEGALDAFDKRNAKHQKSRDAEFNMLKVELTNAQVSRAEMESQYLRKIKELEDAIETINAEVDEEIDEKQAEVDEMQRKLQEQVDEVNRLQREREQLCHNMNSMSNSRKSELDELQNEIMRKTAEVTEQEREIQSLKMQVKKQTDAAAEVEGLKSKVRDLEKKLTTTNGGLSQLNKAKAEEIMAENDRLRENIRQVSLERRALQEKLNAVVADKSSSRSVQVLQQRNAVLKQEVEKLTKRLKQMEGSITRISI